MYGSIARLLGRIQDILQFKTEQLQAHPSDTPLTSRWLWALGKLEQNQSLTGADVESIEHIGQQQLTSSLTLNPNQHLCDLIKTLPVQIQALFYFQCHCACNNEHRHKLSTVLREVSTNAPNPSQIQQDFGEMLLNSNCNCEHPEIYFDTLPTVFAIANNSGQMLVNVPPAFQIQGQTYVFFHSILCDLQKLSLLDAVVNENALAPDALVSFGSPFKEKQLRRAEAQQLLRQCIIQNTHHLFLFFINVDMLSNKMVQNKLLNQATALLMRPEDDQEIQMLEGTGRKVRMEIQFPSGMHPELRKVVQNDGVSSQNHTIQTAGGIGTDSLGLPQSVQSNQVDLITATETNQNNRSLSMTQPTITEPQTNLLPPRSYKQSATYLEPTTVNFGQQRGMTWISIILGILIVFTVVDFVLAVAALAKAGKKQ